MASDVVRDNWPKHRTLAHAVQAVMLEVGYVQKQRTQGLNYSYASEAALIEALRPAMLRHGLSIAPVGAQVISSEPYTTKSGAKMNHVLACCTYRLMHSDSEQFLDLVLLGEGSDSGDKTANKAMTAAYKYALREAFLIETGDDPDKYPSEEQEPPAAQPTPKPPPYPTTGRQFLQSVERADKVLTEEGVIESGELISAVVNGGLKDNLPAALEAWPVDKWDAQRQEKVWGWVRGLGQRFRDAAKQAANGKQ